MIDLNPYAVIINCTIAVTIAPASTPKSGFDNLFKIVERIGKLLNEFAILTIVIIPVNSNPKLNTICPISFDFCFLAFSIIIKPIVFVN